MSKMLREEPKIPKGEHGWVGLYDSSDNLMFVVTSKTASRDVYFLYEVKDNALVKLGKAKDVSDLYEKFDVFKKIRE